MLWYKWKILEKLFRCQLAVKWTVCSYWTLSLGIFMISCCWRTIYITLFGQLIFFWLYLVSNAMVYHIHSFSVVQFLRLSSLLKAIGISNLCIYKRALYFVFGRNWCLLVFWFSSLTALQSYKIIYLFFVWFIGQCNFKYHMEERLPRVTSFVMF